jgi:GntR family transcriptional repressor for pyruvate dehydrogenase complex
MNKPIHSSRLYEQIAQQIEERILRGDLEAGDKLPSEIELAEQFGVSRTAIREAIKALRTKGLVEVHLGRGAFVTEGSSQILYAPLEQAPKIDQDDHMESLVEIREILEPKIAALAAERANEDDIHALQDAITVMENSLNDVDSFVEADLHFHRALATATKNPMVTQLLTPIMDLLSVQITKTFQACESVEEFILYQKQILENIVNRNPQAARDAMYKQLDVVRRCLD